MFWLFDRVGKRRDKKANVDIKIYDLTYWEKIITIHILPNISRSKGNRTMKFGQLLEYDMRNIFACLFSVHNTISLSRHEQVCLIRICFEGYFFHKSWSWHDKLTVLWETYFMKNHTQNLSEKLVRDSFLKNQNWGYLWINNLKFYTDCSIVCLAEGYCNILKEGCRPLAFTPNVKFYFF